MSYQKENYTNDKTEVILVRGTEVLVTKQFKRQYESMNRQYRRKRKIINMHEILYDFNKDDDDYDHLYEITYEINRVIVDNYPMCISAEEAALKNIEREVLREIIHLLSISDQQLIIGLFFYDLTFRELSKIMDMPTITIFDRHKVVLGVLRKKIKNF